MSWGQAVKNIWKGVGDAITAHIVKMIMQWLGFEKVKTAATEEGETERLAITMWGSIKALAIKMWEAIKTIAIKAWEGAAAAYASIAAIPVVGPFLAPAVAAGVVASIIGFGARIASAAGGWDTVPHDQIAQVHKGEMVMSAPLAQGLRDIIRNGQTGAGGKHEAYHVTVNAMDTASFTDALRRNQTGMIKVMKEAARNGRA